MSCCSTDITTMECSPELDELIKEVYGFLFLHLLILHNIDRPIYWFSWLVIVFFCAVFKWAKSLCFGWCQYRPISAGMVAGGLSQWCDILVPLSYILYIYLFYVILKNTITWAWQNWVHCKKPASKKLKFTGNVLPLLYPIILEHNSIQCIVVQV